MTQFSISVLLVDDRAVVREGYRQLLQSEADLHIRGEAANAMQAYQRSCALSQNVVVMDVSLPGASDVEATRRIVARSSAARVLMFSVHDEMIFVRRALDAGALGYVTKASAPEVLVDAVHSVGCGTRYLSSDVAQGLATRDALCERPSGRSLSAREFEVLQLLVQGYSLSFIAERLGVSEKTVAIHQSVIRNKFAADNGVQLARMVDRLGLHFSTGAVGFT
jgi:two-component system invasion response regulator UvrY